MAWAASPSSTTPPGPDAKPYARGSGRSSRTSCGTRSSGRVAASSSPTGGVPAGEPAPQQGELGGRRFRAGRTGGGGHPVDAAPAGRAVAERHGDEPVAGAQGLAADRLLRRQLRHPVAGDDGLPRGEAGADRDRLGGERRAGPGCRCRPRRPAGRPRSAVRPSPTAGRCPRPTRTRGDLDAGADVHPVAEPGDQRVVQVLQVHHRRRRARAGPGARRDQPLPVRAAYPAVGQRRGDRRPAAVRVERLAARGGRWARAPARSAAAATRSPRSSRVTCQPSRASAPAAASPAMPAPTTTAVRTSPRRPSSAGRRPVGRPTSPAGPPPARPVSRAGGLRRLAAPVGPAGRRLAGGSSAAVSAGAVRRRSGGRMPVRSYASEAAPR